MGRKNKNYSKTLHQQTYEKLVGLQAFGESKAAAKKDGTYKEKIFSFTTYLWTSTQSAKMSWLIFGPHGRLPVM